MDLGEAPARLQEALYRGYTGLVTRYKSLLARVLVREDLPPSSYRRARRLIEILSRILLVAPIIGAPLLLYNHVAAVLVLLAPLLAVPASYIAAGMWRSIRAYGVDQEVPLLLAYLLPYTHTPRYIADLIKDLPASVFKRMQGEAERLQALLDAGEDPLRALRRLADTTPSKKLSMVLKDYIAAQSLGASRSQITVSLLNHALSTIREYWKRYTELGNLVSEAVVTAIIAVSALTPVTILTGQGLGPLGVIAVLAPLTGAGILLMARPEMGEPRPPSYITIILLAAPLAASILLYTNRIPPAILLLAAASIVGEYWWRRISRSMERGIRGLRMAGEAAKYRGDYEKHLKEAEGAASKLVEALTSAVRIAGKLGASTAISTISSVLEEVSTAIKSTRIHALVHSILAIVAIGLGIYTGRLIEEAAASSGIAQQGVEWVYSVLRASAPLAPLPAVIVYRGRTPSLIPSLVSAIILLLL